MCVCVRMSHMRLSRCLTVNWTIFRLNLPRIAQFHKLDVAMVRTVVQNNA